MTGGIEIHFTCGTCDREEVVRIRPPIGMLKRLSDLAPAGWRAVDPDTRRPRCDRCTAARTAAPGATP